MKTEMAVELMRALLCESTSETPCPWKVGEAYLIRCVTHYWTGRVVSIGAQELVLSDAAWIADTGRFHQCSVEGKPNDVEPVNGVVIIGRGSIVDAIQWKHELPRTQL